MHWSSLSCLGNQNLVELQQLSMVLICGTMESYSKRQLKQIQHHGERQSITHEVSWNQSVFDPFSPPISSTVIDSKDEENRAD